MKKVGVSELKARLAHYLRRAKSGEEIVISERGIPVAILSSISSEKESVSITPPRRAPELLGKFEFTTKCKKTFDVVHMLVNERKQR